MTFVQLLECLNYHTIDLSEVKGISYRVGQEIIHNADRGYIDEAILNYYEVVKHLLVNNENHGLIYDAYRELIYLYYDKDDFKSAMKMAECLWKLYLEHRDWENNGHDVIFYLLELSILTCQEKLFDHYVKEGEHLKD